MSGGPPVSETCFNGRAVINPNEGQSNYKMETVSILGCGWLGLPLAVRLIEKGYAVKGSTRTPEKLDIFKSLGIEPFHLVLDPCLTAEDTDQFFESDILVINFPPERRDDIVDYHRAQINSLASHIRRSPIKKVLFVSSTSVYPELNRELFEDEEAPPSKPSGKALLEAEAILKGQDGFETTVIRFGGLIGYDRRPGRFLAGKREIKNGDAPVNLIHRDDCIEIISRIIDENIRGETLNACADLHPKRKDYYIAQALKLGLEPPLFNPGADTGFKIVRSDKLKKLLKYEFKYPDPSLIDEDPKRDK